MMLYYSGIVAFGIINLTKDKVLLGGTYVGHNVWVLFCATIILLGSIGILARLRDARTAESIVLYTLAGAYAILAILFINTMGWSTAPDIFIRIITTPILMAVTARMVRNRLISSRDVEAALKQETLRTTAGQP